MLEIKTQATHALNEISTRPWELCGLGLYYTWFFILFSRIGSFPSLAEIPLERSLFCAIFSLSFIAIAAFYHATERKNREKLANIQSVPFIGAACMSLSTFTLAYLPAFSNNIVPFVFLGILSGIGCALFLLSWGTFFSNIKSYRIVVHLLFSLFIAAILRWIIAEVPTELGSILTTALPMFSCGILINSKHSEEKSRPQQDSAQKPTLLKLTVCLGVVSFLYGVVKNLSLFIPSLSNESSSSYLISSLIFLILAFVILLTLSGPLVTRFYRVALFAMIIGAAGAYLDSETISQASLLLLSCGQYLFQGIVWLVSAYALVTASNKVLSTFALAVLVSEIGTLVGSALGSLVGLYWPSILDIETTFDVSCAILIMAVCFVFVFSLKEKDMDIFAANRDLVLLNADEAIQLRCEEISLRADLTKREVEVFLLLVKGRSVPYISEKLILSNSTIKTHVKHIYKKVGVHSRQELHSLIDNPKEV